VSGSQAQVQVSEPMPFEETTVATVYTLLSIQMAAADQDQHLDAIYDSVQRLGQLSLNIHDELDAQSQMLEEAEAEMDATQAAVNETNKRIKVLIDANGGSKWCAAVACLTCIVVVLFFLILAGA